MTLVLFISSSVILNPQITLLLKIVGGSDNRVSFRLTANTRYKGSQFHDLSSVLFFYLRISRLRDKLLPR
jgi:hypothetical protein